MKRHTRGLILLISVLMCCPREMVSERTDPQNGNPDGEPLINWRAVIGWIGRKAISLVIEPPPPPPKSFVERGIDWMKVILGLIGKAASHVRTVAVWTCTHVLTPEVLVTLAFVAVVGFVLWGIREVFRRLKRRSTKSFRSRSRLEATASCATKHSTQLIGEETRSYCGKDEENLRSVAFRCETGVTKVNALLDQYSTGSEEDKLKTELIKSCVCRVTGKSNLPNYHTDRSKSVSEKVWTEIEKTILDLSNGELSLGAKERFEKAISETSRLGLIPFLRKASHMFDSVRGAALSEAEAINMLVPHLPYAFIVELFGLYKLETLTFDMLIEGAQNYEQMKARWQERSKATDTSKKDIPAKKALERRTVTNQRSQSAGASRNAVTCFKGGKKGHYAAQCRSQRRKDQMRLQVRVQLAEDNESFYDDATLVEDGFDVATQNEIPPAFGPQAQTHDSIGPLLLMESSSLQHLRSSLV